MDKTLKLFYSILYLIIMFLLSKEFAKNIARATSFSFQTQQNIALIMLLLMITVTIIEISILLTKNDKKTAKNTLVP